MDRVWKYFTVLVLIEMAFLIYLYVIIFNNSTTLSNVEMIEVKERGEDFVDEKTKAYIFPPQTKMDRHKKIEGTRYMTIRLVNSSTTDKPKNSKQQLKKRPSPFSNVIKKMRAGGYKNDFTVAKLLNSKKWNTLAGGNVRPYNTSYISSKSDKSCIFSFDNESLLKAREQLSFPYYLFNVHLRIDGLHGLSMKNQDILLHWQYVLKKENFLIQLPVDVDLLTYTLLEIDKEETTISIKLLYNDSNCFKNNFSEAIRSVEFLLWNKLFLNDTDYFLCKRHYESAVFRNILYYLTTIWVGYDLTCSEVSTRNGLHVIQDLKMEKGCTPVITSIFCYILSLQFVWIFVLLDVGKFSKLEPDTDKTSVKTSDGKNSPEHSETSQNDPENSETNRTTSENISTTNKNCEQNKCDLVKKSCCPEFSESNNITFYTRNERPYGLRRFILKILYGKCSCSCCCCKCFCKNCCIHNPTMRLLIFMWVFILLPFGFYRTYGRYEILRNTYEYSLIVARLSEPLFYWIDQNAFMSISEGLILFLDILYATVCPFFYIFVGRAAYEVFSSNDMRMFYCVSKDEDHSLVTDNERIAYRFAFRYFQFCRSLGKLCCHKDSLMDNNGCKFTCKCTDCLTCTFSFIYCIFPCIPFSLFTNKHKDCVCLRDENKEPLKDKKNSKSRCDKKCGTWKCCCPHKKKQLKCCCTLSEFIRTCCLVVLNIVFLLIIIVPTYLLFLRPILSTFTFLFRSFTYIVFVVFPIRTYIMRVTIIIVTAIVYFSKYIHEIVNMNTEILNYILKLKEEKEHNNLNTEQINRKDRQGSKVEKISEKEFDVVYEKLMFVKKGFYLLYLKVVVVIMYLIITFTTFIMNTKSLTGSDFKDILQFLLIIIGPYAIIFFIKANNSDFLTEENKRQIQDAYENACEKKDVENPPSTQNLNQSSLSGSNNTNENTPPNQQRGQKNDDGIV